MRIRISLKPLSGLSVGAAFHGTLSDLGTSRDIHNTAFVPATAIRGALREAAERLTGETNPLVETLFGTKAPPTGSDPEEGVLGFSDLTGEGPEELYRRTAIRPGVSLSRRARSALPGFHFQRETFPPDAEALFSGIIHCSRDLSEQEENLLQQSARLVELTGIGGGRSSGLGKVKITLAQDDTKPSSEDRASGLYILTANFKARFRSGRGPGSDYFMDTMSHLTPRTVRGALCTALSQTGTNPDVESLRCSGLLPACEGDAFSIPIPMTSVAPKYGGSGEIWDTLFWHLAGEPSGNPLVLPPSEVDLGEQKDIPLSPVAGFLSQEGHRVPAPDRLSSTHLELSRITGTAKSGKLWSLRTVTPDEETSTWSAFVRLSHKGSLPKQAFFGSGKNRGLGFASLSFRPASEILTPLQERFDAFNANFSRFTAEMGLPLEKGKQFWSALLVTPAVADLSTDDFTSLLKKQGAPKSVQVTFTGIRQGQMGGFWQKAGIPAHRVSTFEQGGLFAGTVSEGDVPEFLEWADKVESDGWGLYHQEGFGWLLFCSEWHSTGRLPYDESQQ